MVDWLSDLSWVPNGAVVFISCTGAAAGSKGRAPPPPPKSAAAASEVDTTAGSGSSSSSGKHGGSGASPGVVPTTAGAGDGGDEAEQQADEDEEEALALAALGRIRESYRTRAKERRSGAAGRVRSDVSDEEAGKRMMDKRREVENTVQSRQASNRVQQVNVRAKLA